MNHLQRADRNLQKDSEFKFAEQIKLQKQKVCLHFQLKGDRMQNNNTNYYLLKHRVFFKKMGQTRPLFVYFRSFHMTNIGQIL